MLKVDTTVEGGRSNEKQRTGQAFKRVFDPLPTDATEVRRPLSIQKQYRGESRKDVIK